MGRPLVIQHATPTQRIIDVDPDLAKKWLLLNKLNRKIKPFKIAQYTRDMKEGHWEYTGEPLKFSTEGNILDGQNRLHAIIDSQTTQSFLVVTGLQQSAQDVMDSGAPRTAGDALHLHGYGTPNELASTVRAHYMWKKVGLKHCMIKTGSSGAPSNAEIVDYVNANPGLINASKISKPVSRFLHLPHGAVAAAYYELALIDEAEAKDFFESIIQLRTWGVGDPVNTLIKRSQQMDRQREHVRAPLGLYMILRAWNARRDNEVFEKFQFGSESRGWAPIPDPK